MALEKLVCQWEMRDEGSFKMGKQDGLWIYYYERGIK